MREVKKLVPLLSAAVVVGAGQDHGLRFRLYARFFPLRAVRIEAECEAETVKQALGNITWTNAVSRLWGTYGYRAFGTARRSAELAEQNYINNLNL